MCNQFATLVIVLVWFGASWAGTCELQLKATLTGPIWIGVVGDVGHSTPSNGGFIMNPEQQLSLYVPSDWSGKLWARTWCKNDVNSKHCQTGDCGNKIECAGAAGTPPITLVHLMLRTGVDNVDAYEISLVEGFNVAVSITPIDGEGDCKTLACRRYLTHQCPKELKSFLGWDKNVVIGCHSSCTKFNTDQYCCTGAFSNPHRCNPRNWTVNSARFFKDNCPDGRSYPFDEERYSYTCLASKYKIVFSERDS